MVFIKRIFPAKELAEELHESITYTSTIIFIDYILGADLADMELTSKFNKLFRLLLSFIYIFS